MSSSITVYAVSLEQLKQVVGSRAQQLIDSILNEQEGFLSSIDDIDDGVDMTCAEAVAALINGERPDDAPGYLFGYALEAVCSTLGDELPNISQIAGAADWIEEVDALLERKGIPVRLEQLVYYGSPVPIPEPDDYPFIGIWPASLLAAASTSFQTVDLSDVEPRMAETLQQLAGWVKVASSKPGTSIIGFLS